MFTKHYYNSLMVMLTGATIENGITTPEGKVYNITKATGSSSMGSAYSYLSASNSVVQKTYNAGIILGTGNTPPTREDYKLSGDLITEISAAVASRTKATDEAGAYTTAIMTVTNTGTEPITVREVGFMGFVYRTSTNSSECVLLERTVLDEPVTIAPGGVGQITYTIRMNYPTA